MYVRILLVNGSPAGADSANGRLLRALPLLSDASSEGGSGPEWTTALDLSSLPLFTPGRLTAGRPPVVEAFAQAVASADAVVISTPEYAHNVPAALKSALEWLVASGELAGTPVVAMTATPAPPRGEHCMRSLVATLRAMDARVVVEMPVYSVAAKLAPDGSVADAELREELSAMMELIQGAAGRLPHTHPS